MRRLTIEVTAPGLVTMRAVKELLREPRLKANLRLNLTPRAQPGAGVLRIESASVVRPVLSVLWGDEQQREPAASDIRVALSQEIWADGKNHEPWRVTAAPMPERSKLLGQPDLSRPWVLVAAGVTLSPEQVAAVTGIREPQLHFLGFGPASGNDRAVRWLPKRAVVSALLGNVDAVVAPPGPLAWDAARAGVPVFHPTFAPRMPPGLATRRLTRLVPTALVGDSAFWRGLAADLLTDAPSSPWGTAAWMLEGRARATHRAHGQSVSKLTTATRKLRKLRNDPVAFWNDSWFVRRAGHAWRGA